MMKDKTVFIIFGIVILLGFCGCDNSTENVVHPYMICVVGEVDEVIKEEISILDTQKYRTIGYKIKVLVPCFNDFDEGDEFSIYSAYQRQDVDKEPSELSNGDVVIISYLVESHKVINGDHVLNDGLIWYGNQDNLNKFAKISNEKVQDFIDKISDENSVPAYPRG